MNGVKALLAELRSVCADPRARLDEALSQGRKTVGVLPYFCPEELVYAAGLLPFGTADVCGTPGPPSGPFIAMPFLQAVKSSAPAIRAAAAMNPLFILFSSVCFLYCHISVFYAAAFFFYYKRPASVCNYLRAS